MASDRSEVLHDLSQSGKPLKPIATSLNGDNSWLFSIPYPSNATNPASKAYYHMVSDAWLTGSAVTIHSWMISIGLTEAPAATSGADVEGIVREIELAASTNQVSDQEESAISPIDLIMVNANAHDHLHEETLRTFNPDIPVLTLAECMAEICSLNHFKSVTTYSDLVGNDADWQSLHPGKPLPDWLTIFRMGNHFLDFMTAIVWTTENGTHEVVLYSPHGISSHDSITSTLLTAKPKLSIVALLHCLHTNWSWSKQITAGIEGGLKLEDAVKPKYWVQTHDQPLNYSGIVMRILRVNDVQHTLESVIGQPKTGGNQAEKVRKEIGSTFVRIPNGSCYILA